MIEAPLAIALPLLACILALPLRGRAPHLLWVAVPGSLALAWSIAARVRMSGVASLALGGWEPPLGIVLRADGLAAAFIGLSAIVASAVGLYALPYLAAGGNEPRRQLAFWPLLFAVWTSANAIFLGQDLFNLYVAIEMLTLSAVAMVALEGRAANFAAAMRYMLFALFGSLAFLIGVALLYGAYGTLDILQLAAVVRPEPATHAAAALMTLGLFAKTALFPFHAWLPPAHGGAPAPSSALLSALVVKASFYILLRLWFDLFPPLATATVVGFLGLLGALAIVAGSLLALRQQRLKTIIAYSTVAQIGYLFLVFPLVDVSASGLPWAASAWTGGIFHGLAHGLAKAAMFLAAGAMILAAGDDRLESLAGSARAVPVATFAFAISAVSLMGLPPSGGFTAKYLMMKASIASGQWGWGLVVIAGGLLAGAYLLRPLSRIMAERPDSAPAAVRVHWMLEWVPLALALGATLLGILSLEPYLLVQIGSPRSTEVGLR